MLWGLLKDKVRMIKGKIVGPSKNEDCYILMHRTSKNEWYPEDAYPTRAEAMKNISEVYSDSIIVKVKLPHKPLEKKEVV